MKQTTNKMFRGCPYEKENFENCSMCPNYEYCLKLKKYKIHKRKMQRIKRLLIKLIIALSTILCVFGIVYLIISISTNNKAETNNNESTRETVSNVLEPTETTMPKAELSADGPSDTYYYNISEEDKIIIAKVVWAESRGECFEGKVAVAAVVLNRYYSGISYFDTESIFAVATKPYQFASIENVTIEELEKNPDCMKAVEVACKGWDPTRKMFSKGALYFYNPKRVSGYQAEIREGIPVMVIGNHNFHYDFEKVE